MKISPVSNHAKEGETECLEGRRMMMTDGRYDVVGWNCSGATLWTSTRSKVTTGEIRTAYGVQSRL